MEKLLRNVVALMMLLCFSAPAWAIELVDGVYQISSAADLRAFAELVNGGETAVDAVLTADIVADADQPMIGQTLATAFSGHFDGQGHCITLQWTGESAPAQDPSGLFAYLKGYISNLRLDGIFEARSVRSGALAGRVEAAVTIRNVISNVTMVGLYAGDSALSGLVARPSVAGVIIENCIYTGTMRSNVACNIAPLIGWNAAATTMRNSAFLGKLLVKDAALRASYGLTNVVTNLLGRANGTLTAENCYYLPLSLTDEEQAEGYENITAALAGSAAIDAQDIESGKLTYQLNGDQSEIVWYQMLGEDTFPSLDPSRGQVYLNGRAHCDGTPYDEAFYSNADEGFTQDKHNFVDGVCSVCGEADPDFMTIGEDGFYQIGTAGQLVWFASKVNVGDGALNARLTAPIDMDGVKWQPIGTIAVNYSGTFDGQLYPITNLNGMLFGTTNAATLTGIAIESGNVSTNAGAAAHTGSIVGHALNKTSLSNSYSKAFIQGGEGDLGGVAGKFVGPITNVLFAGTFGAGITTWSSGGLAGSSNNGDTPVTNCLVIAHFENEDALLAEGEHAAFIGWCHANTVTNSYAIAATESRIGFTKLCGGSTNWTLAGGTTFVDEEQLASGEVAWKLNDQKFADVAWYQTVGSDEHPTLDSTHEVVYPTVNGYASAGVGNFDQMRKSLIDAELDYCNNAVANVDVKAIYQTALKELENITERDAFIDAYTALKTLRADVEKSEQDYARFDDAVQDIYQKALESSIGGPDMEFLLDYIENEYDPSEDYPRGSYPYIMATMTLNGEQLAAETDFVSQLWLTAQKNGYKAGDEISSMFANHNLSDGFSGWEYTKTGSTFTTGGVKEVMPAAESWNATFVLSQTVTGLTDGYYQLEVNAAFRAAGDLYNTNYAAWAYMNANETLVMTEGEDVVSEDDARDLENCYINGGQLTDEEGNHIGAYDYYYEDADNSIYGYVPYGPLSCSYAFKGGRYVNTIVAQVTDGSLTVGLKLPGTGQTADWMGFGNFRVTYLGGADSDLTSNAYDTMLAGMVARSNTILAYKGSSGTDFAAKPEFCAALRAELEEEIADVTAATTINQKQALAQRFAETFRAIYDCKKAYVNYMNYVEVLFNTAWAQAASDPQLAEGTMLVELQDFMDNVFAPKWENGAYTQQEAEEMNDLKSLALYEYFYSVPLDIVDGKYQITSADDLKALARIVNFGSSAVNAVLTADITIGSDQAMIGTIDNPYRGNFDGQGHTITFENVEWQQPNSDASEASGLFAHLAGNVSNLYLNGEITTYGMRTGVLAGRLEDSSIITNVVTNVTLRPMVNGDTAASLLVSRPSAGSSQIINCMALGGIYTETGSNAGGLVGWNPNDVKTTIQNSVMLGVMQVAPTSATTPTDLIGRCLESNAPIVLNNVFYITHAENTNVERIWKGAAAVTAEAVTDGELCYRLNGDQSEIVWFQTLTEDAYPVPDDRHLVVMVDENGRFYNDGQAIGQVKLEQYLPSVVNVYDIQGRLVRSGVDVRNALKDIPQGMYILGGKKVLK